MRRSQMRLADVQAIIRFNARMGMFVCPSSRAGVVAFLHGYEYGTRGACQFTALLSRHIASRYHVKADSLGWPDQISRLAERQSLEWIDVYQVVSAEILGAGLKSTPRKATDVAAAKRERRSSPKKRQRGLA